MTPIKYLLLMGTALYTVDHADQTMLMCVSPNEGTANWVGNSLSAFHGVPVFSQPQGEPAEDPEQPELPVEQH